jgi:hypothetical protein
MTFHPTNEQLLTVALTRLVEAIGKKWDGETERRRSNALSPNIEDALLDAKRILGIHSDRKHFTE